MPQVAVESKYFDRGPNLHFNAQLGISDIFRIVIWGSYICNAWVISQSYSGCSVEVKRLAPASTCSILQVHSSSLYLFSLSSQSVVISSCFVAPVMFLWESFSFIEPWVYIFLTPMTGLHVKTQIIDWLFVRTGVLIWALQLSINHSERLPFINTWFVCADCSLAENLLFCGSWLLISDLLSDPPATEPLPLIRLSVLVLSSCYLTAGCSGCFGGEHPIYSPGFWVSSVHLDVSIRQGREPLLGCLLSLW